MWWSVCIMQNDYRNKDTTSTTSHSYLAYFLPVCWELLRSTHWAAFKYTILLTTVIILDVRSPEQHLPFTIYLIYAMLSVDWVTILTTLWSRHQHFYSLLKLDLGGTNLPPAEGSGNLFQDSCLKNSMDRGAWQATVHGVAKSRTLLSD